MISFIEPNFSSQIAALKKIYSPKPYKIPLIYKKHFFFELAN